ncbi:MAG: hypothetical protein AAF772_03030 [Acidobacteriota bacterium]
MTTLQEGELRFTFPDDWRVEPFDIRGREGFPPLKVKPVDFVVERAHDILLIEVKDPSNSGTPSDERVRFVKKMTTKSLTYDELVPKARTTWSVLHLMGRTDKPLRFIVAIGVEALAIEPPLFLQLTDRLKKRLEKEIDVPWVRPYVADAFVVDALELDRHFPGIKVTRDPAVAR